MSKTTKPTKAEFIERVTEGLTRFLETNANGVELLDGNVLITHVFNGAESPLCIRLTVDMLFAQPTNDESGVSDGA